MIQHIQNVHRKQYKCDRCDFTTPNITILANHCEEIHENDGKNIDDQSKTLGGE